MMIVSEVFTAESIEKFRRRTKEATTPGKQLLDQYRQDREAQIKDAPDLQLWIDALEDGDLAAAADPGLWGRMAEQGFIEIPVARTPYPDRATFLLRIISPKVFDAFRTEGQPKLDFAFTTVKVCLRGDPVPAGLTPSPDWEAPMLIDTELFEVPNEVSDDMFDDLEKIHIIYLAAVRKGQFVCKPVYIGVGTGEAYGTGSRRRTTRGRFRLYRYDVKDNFHLEYIRLSEGEDEERENVQTLPPPQLIGDSVATMVLGKSADGGNFMSLSDPEVMQWYAEWLKTVPVNRLIFRTLTLEKVHDDIGRGQATTPFAPDDVHSVLQHAWRVQRWYYIAWQHPGQLSKIEGIDLYYDQLPSFRREEYEIYRFKPEIFLLSEYDPEAASLTIPSVLRSDKLRRQLELSCPGVVAELDQWLQALVVKDLYAYGGHPELRLCTAIALWCRMSESELWDAMVESTYRKRLFEVELNAEHLGRARAPQ